jgi:CRP/FNR family transcriptional regulator, transcriptional activator FtrB
MAEVKVGVDLLRSIPLFGKLSNAHLANLAVSVSLRRFAPRTVLFTEGDRPGSLYILVNGAVELFSEQDERHATVAVVRGAGPLVLYSILSEHTPLSGRVLERSELIVAPAKPVVALFGQDPDFASTVIQELASECRRLVECFKSHRLRSTTERVAHWMLHCDRTSGLTGQIVIPFDKRVLASYLGMAPEHLSRSFSALASAGVVVHGRNVTLNDRAALVEAAGLIAPE